METDARREKRISRSQKQNKNTGVRSSFAIACSFDDGRCPKKPNARSSEGSVRNALRGRGRGEGERKRDKKREIVRNTKSRIFHRIYLSSGPRSALAIYLSHGVSPLRCPTPRRALVALSTYFTYSIACCRAHPHPCTLTLCTSCHARSCASSPLSGLASRLRACLAWGGLSHPTPPPRSAAPVAPRTHAWTWTWTCSTRSGAPLASARAGATQRARSSR